MPKQHKIYAKKRRKQNKDQYDKRKSGNSEEIKRIHKCESAKQSYYRNHEANLTKAKNIMPPMLQRKRRLLRIIMPLMPKRERKILKLIMPLIMKKGSNILMNIMHPIANRLKKHIENIIQLLQV